MTLLLVRSRLQEHSVRVMDEIRKSEHSSKALFNHIKYLVGKGRKCIRKEVEDDIER